jgi:hypothetical protein
MVVMSRDVARRYKAGAVSVGLRNEPTLVGAKFARLNDSGAAPANKTTAPRNDLMMPGRPAYIHTAKTDPYVARPPKPKLIVPHSPSEPSPKTARINNGDAAKLPSIEYCMNFNVVSRLSGAA